ncbi:MAG: hypothetical protein M1820_000536 [Bogoriella megaspora]|nr:MAG: hypothetical protein M1820_000536 [Bogoriella megaspora]
MGKVSMVNVGAFELRESAPKHLYYLGTTVNSLVLDPYQLARTAGIPNIDTNSNSYFAYSSHTKIPTPLQEYVSQDDYSYPTKEEIHSLFDALLAGRRSEFSAKVDPNITWTVMGSHPLAGAFHSPQEFQAATVARLQKIMKEDDPVKLAVTQVVRGGEQDWGVVEMKAIGGTCKNGRKWTNQYVWFHRWNKNRKIVEVRTYMDSAFLRDAIEENE